MDIVNLISTIVLFSGIIYSLYKFILRGNISFFKILESFENKLPPKDKTSQKTPSSGTGFTHLNLDTLETHITTKDLDIFLKNLEDFNYDKIHFKRKKIIDYSNNIQRIIKSNDTKNSDFHLKFNISMLQNFLKEKNSKPYLYGFNFYEFIKC